MQIERLAASSAGQHNLSMGKIDILEIPVPPLETQTELVSRMQDSRRDHERCTQTIEPSLERSKVLRRAVLVAAFDGRLTGHRVDEEIIEKEAARVG